MYFTINDCGRTPAQVSCFINSDTFLCKSSTESEEKLYILPSINVTTAVSMLSIFNWLTKKRITFVILSIHYDVLSDIILSSKNLPLAY